MYLVCRPASPLFPYTTLFRSRAAGEHADRHHAGRLVGGEERPGVGRQVRRVVEDESLGAVGRRGRREGEHGLVGEVAAEVDDAPGRDRKSTRLNSSHRCTSYAAPPRRSFPTRRSSDLAPPGNTPTGTTQAGW